MNTCMTVVRLGAPWGDLWRGPKRTPMDSSGEARNAKGHPSESLEARRDNGWDPEGGPVCGGTPKDSSEMAGRGHPCIPLGTHGPPAGDSTRS